MPNRLRLPAAVLLLLLGPTLLIAKPTVAVAQPRSSGTLASQLAQTLKGSSAKHLDYNVVGTGSGTISHNARTATAPASNQKLFTAITLMQLLGPNFRYRTRLKSTARIVQHQLHGDLVLRAAGDPTLTTGDLTSLARKLHAKGLHHVTGHLYVDDSRYSHKTRVAGWKPKFVPRQSGTVDAFTVNGNQWRHNASFDRNPTPANAHLLRKALTRAHISVARTTLLHHAPRTKFMLAGHASATLAAITDAVLTDSINFYAEMMLREAGAQRYGHGSPHTGIAAERALAARLGLPLGVVHDGSGLSYTDRETPLTITDWLVRLKSLPYYTTIYYALPLSCTTGTLTYRLCGPNVRGRVRAKTGTLTHVSTLSGYVTSRAGHPITFSFFASGVRHFSKLYARVDAAVALLWRKG